MKDATGKIVWSPVDVGFIDLLAQFKALKAIGYSDAVRMCELRLPHIRRLDPFPKRDWPPSPTDKQGNFRWRDSAHGSKKRFIVRLYIW